MEIFGFYGRANGWEGSSPGLEAVCGIFQEYVEGVMMITINFLLNDTIALLQMILRVLRCRFISVEGYAVLQFISFVVRSFFFVN